MARRRIQRVNEQLKREITEILRGEFRDPRVGLVSVSRVDTAADLARSRVLLSVTGDEAEKREALEGARAAASFIRGALGRRIELRHVPELHFELDRTLEHALRIEEVLREVLPDPDPDADADGDEPRREGGGGG